MPYTLSAAVLLTAGSALLRNDAVIAALVCWGLLLPVMLSAFLDRIEFDGRIIRRRGPLASLIARVSRTRQQLAISDIEAISTETTSLSFANGDARLIYRTHIHGAGVEMYRSSRPRTVHQGIICGGRAAQAGPEIVRDLRVPRNPRHHRRRAGAPD
jgi:hypothetical protein